MPPSPLYYDLSRVGTPDGQPRENFHDRALLRANWPPRSSRHREPPCTLFVGRLDDSTTCEDLKRSLGVYGSIVDANVVRHAVTGESRRYAFVECRTPRDADLILAGAQGLLLNGRRLLIDREHCRTLANWVPRRLGGGFGGRISSGQIRFGGRSNPYKYSHHSRY